MNTTQQLADILTPPTLLTAQSHRPTMAIAAYAAIAVLLALADALIHRHRPITPADKTADTTTEPDLLDLNLIVDLLRHAGINALIEDTGAGVSICIGHGLTDPEDPGYARYELMAGPGWVEQTETGTWRAVAHSHDFYVNRDDDGATGYWVCPTGVSEAYVSGYVIHTMKAFAQAT